MEEERLRPPSPPPVVHYTDHEAATVAEKLKQDDTFTKAVQVSKKCYKDRINWNYLIIEKKNEWFPKTLLQCCEIEYKLFTHGRDHRRFSNLPHIHTNIFVNTFNFNG